jgi:HSP20 family protein
MGRRVEGVGSVSFGRAGGNVDEFFAELFSGPRLALAGGVRAPADVYLTDDPPTVTVQLELAGVDPAQLDVELDGDTLRIRGHRLRPRSERRVYQHAEIQWGRFERRLRLLVAVDPEGVTASYDRGLLTIALPLARDAPPTRVPISVTLPE